MKTLIFSLLLMTTSSASVGQPMDVMAERLHSLRSEVEQLNLKLESEKKKYQSQLQSLSLQKGDLNAELNREKIQAEQINAQVTKLKSRLSGTSGEDQMVSETVKKIIATIKSYVEGSLPYKKSERLGDLQKINDLLTNQLLTPQKAMARLWSFVEDEIRLTKESSLSRQNIMLDGKSVLAEVIKIGMLQLYFSTSEGKVGQIVKTNANDWSYVVYSEDEQIELTKKLFASFKKKIRKGYFKLPNVAGL